MFGYVKPFQPEMKLKEYDAYKSVYCGLCKELGRSYGVLARLTLSYDFTFLAILAMSVKNAPPHLSRVRCLVNPFKRCTACKSGDLTAFAAAQAMITLHYKIQDQLADEGFWGRIPAYLLSPLFSHFRKKAAENYPLYDQLAAVMMEDQVKAEQALSGPDLAAEPTARYLSALCESLSDDPVQKRILQRFGYLLGRYVYLSDALDDLEKDHRKGRFNPYLTQQSLQEIQKNNYSFCRESINGTIAEISKSFALLQLDDWRPVLENIIDFGLSHSLQTILTKKEKYHDRSL